MSAGDEIIMPVAKSEAVAMAEIHALRQISDALQATNRSLQSLSDDVKDVRERVIKIEAKDMEAKITEFRGECRTSVAALTSDLKAACLRIDQLESVRDQQNGAMGVGTWLAKNAPWLLAGIAAFAAGIGIKDATP